MDDDVPSQKVVECDLCGDTFNIAWYCKNCPGSLCDKCHRQHQTAPLFKTHNLVQRTETVLRTYGPGKISEQCTIHPEKEIITYCNECNCPCCVTCQVKDHNGHNLSTIEDKYLTTEKGLNKYVQDLETDIKPQIDEMVETVKAEDERRGKEIQKTEDEINSFRCELIQTVNLACDSEINTLREYKTSTQKCLRSLEENRQRICILQEEIGTKIRVGNLNIIEYTPPQKESLVSSIALPVLLYLKYEPNRHLLKEISSGLGEVKEMSTSTCRTDESSLSGKPKSFSSAIGVTSMTAAGSNMVWVMNWDSEVVYLYDVNGDIVRTVTVKGSKGIRDMVLNKSGEMIVSCFDRKIRKVSTNGQVSVLVDATPFEQKGVCLDERENVVVCMAGQRKENHIAVYSQCGCRKLSEKRGIDVNGTYLITDPYRVVQIGSDMCVVNVGNIVCIDKTDHVKWLYNPQEAPKADVFHPYAICIDNFDNILVVDFESSAIHKLSKEGVLKVTQQTKDWIYLRSPQGICVDKYTGYLMYGNVKRAGGNCGEIVVLKPGKTFNV